MSEGIAAEQDGIDLGDKRLSERSSRILDALSVNPAASGNSACGWSDALTAYATARLTFGPREERTSV